MTMGEIILNKRKELGLTQSELASKLNVTDKAVSKWERNASCPDIGTIPKLAEVLGIDVNELIGSDLMTTPPPSSRWSPSPDKGRQEAFSDIVALVLKAVPLAMGVAVCVLSFLGQLEAKDGLGLLGIGLTCLAINNFRK